MIKELLQRLAFLGGSLHVVGGPVRDLMLGREPDDIDMASALPPDEVIRRCEAEGLRVVPTGVAHGTVTVHVPVGDAVEEVEITTFRRDVATDGRNATVAWADTVEEDLARRDFTINAMAMKADGVIVDPFGGQVDLARRELRCVGSPRARFQEDYLRIVRAFRFASRFGLRLDSGLVDQAFDLAAAVADRVSVERVVQEMDKAFKQCADPSAFLDRMERSGILRALVPELGQLRFRPQNPKYHPEGDAWAHTLEVVERAPVADREWQVHRWAALLHDIGKATSWQKVEGQLWFSYHGHAPAGAELIGERIGQELRLPLWLTEKLAVTTRLHMRPLELPEQVRPKHVRRLQAEAGEHLADLAVLCEADAPGRADPALFEPLEEPPVPVLMGRHLIEAGYAPGPAFKPMLDRAFEHQLETGERDVEALIKVAAS